MHLSLVKKKWHFLLGIIQGYITCEGRYSLYFIHHFLLLMVFMGYELNIPFFLLKSILKMAHFYQRDHLSSEINIFHHGLMRVLVEFQLNQNNDSWEEFVKINLFLEKSQSSLQTYDHELGFEILNPIYDYFPSHP
jgi:hypothetical protein